MELITLYLAEDIPLEDIAICAMRASFKTYYSQSSTNSLGIEHVVEFQGEYITSTWLCMKSDAIELYEDQPEQLGETEIQAIKTLKPKSAFAIFYRKIGFQQLRSLLKTILDTYEGWVQESFDGHTYYSIENLDDLISVLEGN